MLEKKLQEACGDDIRPIKDASTNSHGFILEATDSSGQQNAPHPKVEHGIQEHSKDFHGNKQPQTTSVANDGRDSIKQRVRHLEDYVEADLPTHLGDSPQDDPDAESDANLYHKQRAMDPDQDAWENDEEKSSMFSDSAISDAISEETDQSSSGTEDLKVVLQRLDEVISSFARITLSLH